MVRKVVFCALAGLALCASRPAAADVTMTVSPACYHVGDLITVEIHKGITPVAVVGAQFFLTYDTASALYVGGTAGDPPYTFTVIDRVNGSSIDYADGVPGGGPGTTADAVIARLVFKARAESCSNTTFLAYRAHTPPSRMTDNLGNDVAASFLNLTAPITIDSTSPAITTPAAFTLHPSATCTEPSRAPATTGTATATDNCTPTPSIGIGFTDGPNIADTCTNYHFVRTWTATDCAGNTSTGTQTISVVDNTGPTITCPSNESQVSDAWSCAHFYAAGTFPTATATDNCTATGSITIRYSRSDDTPPFSSSHAASEAATFPQGVTTVRWKATDCTGNMSTCDQTVTVAGNSLIVVRVQLANVDPAPFDRCITFGLYRSSPCALVTTVEAVMTFTNGRALATIPIPCQNFMYTAVTARDRLHTLRRTVNGSETPPHFGPSPPNFYFANFLDDSVGHGPADNGNDALLSGNLNDDSVVDVLDFGGLVGQFNANYGTGNTTCSTTPIHADFSGDGRVLINDYTFINSNFLRFRELDPCGGALTDDPGVTDISVMDLVNHPRGGWEMARTADLNRDGRLNLTDMEYFGVHGPARCAADYNNDGAVGVQDVFTFLNNWFNGYPGADTDDNHSVAVADIFAFLGSWFTGCP